MGEIGMRRLLHFVPAAAYMLLIFYLSSHPAPEFAAAFPRWLGMKTLHVVEYGGLALLLNFGLFKGTRWPAARVYTWTFIVTVAYGASDEIHQSFVPMRSAAVSDTIANAIGAAIYVLAHPRAQRLRWLSLLRFRHSASA